MVHKYCQNKSVLKVMLLLMFSNKYKNIRHPVEYNIIKYHRIVIFTI